MVIADLEKTQEDRGTGHDPGEQRWGQRVQGNARRGQNRARNCDFFFLKAINFGTADVTVTECGLPT